MKQTYDNIVPEIGWPPASEISEIIHHRKAANAARDTNCPHIAQFYGYDVSRNGERYFIFMEYAPYQTLSEIIIKASQG